MCILKHVLFKSSFCFRLTTFEEKPLTTFPTLDFQQPLIIRKGLGGDDIHYREKKREQV